jgi:hypothetical protein
LIDAVSNMSTDEALDRLRERATAAVKKLAGMGTDAEVAEAKDLVEVLRNVREYDLMGRLAEAVSRRDPKDPKNRRLYAQYLIETGKATAAIDLLRPLAQRLQRQHPERAEVTGLLGRAYKQIFFDVGDKTSEGAVVAIKNAIEAYRRPFEEDVRNTWHGVNLVALLTRARRLGLRVARDLSPAAVASQVIDALNDTPDDKRDEWFLPTLAEASLGLGDWDAVERHVRTYADVSNANTKAFQIASTLRQFTEVWDLEHVDDRGRALVDMLRARLAEMPDGTVELTPDQVRRLRSQTSPDASQLQAVLGDKGPETYRWWRTGLDRALSVASVRRRLGGRVGTGFLVRARDLGFDPPDELLLLTNFHVVNEQGISPGIRAEEADVTFEAMSPPREHRVTILWNSPIERHDASVLRLEPPVSDMAALPVAAALPGLDKKTLVYIIGHPWGRDLAFSFQDNELLDHEDPPTGQPAIAGVCRVHYSAPTEQGSSGSPVFNARLWEVIALHHSGSKTGLSKLNGKPGVYAANEGISIRSIAAAPKG